MATIIIMVIILLLIVYNRVSDALLEKSENLLTETTGESSERDQRLDEQDADHA